MSSILVVGGAGYLGSSLVRTLQERGHQVQVVDLLWFGQHLPEGVTVKQMDAFQLQESDLHGVDQMVFLAGLSNDPMAEFSPAKNFIFNGALPAYLAYVAKRAGVRRFVYGSSCSVYGHTENGKVYDEDSAVSSNYPYGISKLQGEQAALGLADDSFSVIALRKGTVCGYSPRMRLDLVINTMFKTALTTGEIVINNPEIRRPVLSIQDAVRAYTLAIEAKQHLTGVFNVLSKNYTIGELGSLVKQEIEHHMGRDIRLVTHHKPDMRNYQVSGGKAERVLGFRAESNAESIVADLVANLDKFSDFTNPMYYNIEVFKNLPDMAGVGA